MAEQKPKSKGLGGWLGRQLGYVKKAIQQDVPAKRIYRRTKVEEKVVPGQPNVTVKRNVTEELIVRDEDIGSSQ